MAKGDKQHASRVKILNAALNVFRARGYAATRIEDVCEAAELTKGSFFYHFTSKEDLAVAAAQHWGEVTGGLFAAAPYQRVEDPVDRLLAYVQFRRELIQGGLEEFTCLAGTMVQETYDSHPAIRAACESSIVEHARTVEKIIAEALDSRDLTPTWSASSLALYTQAVLQGGFVLAKAHNGPQVALDCLDHLYRYLEQIFAQSHDKGDSKCPIVPTNSSGTN